MTFVEPGLRERKKIKAMYHIQAVAMDLVEERGYEAVTVEDIAAQAEVSPSSVYRYFGTKEGTILWDQYDPLLVAGVLARVGEMSVFQAIRATINAVIVERFAADQTRIRRQITIAYSVPSLGDAIRRQVDSLRDLLAAGIAEPAGREPGDLEVRAVAAAVVGVLVVAIEAWAQTDGDADDFARLVDRSLAVLENGLTL